MTEKQGTMEVRVTDVNMSFGSMVSFMVKWAIASIPAFIILVVLSMFAIALMKALVTGA